MSLRRQLLLLSLIVLALPLAGWQLVREMEQLLRDSQERALIATAQSLAVRLEAKLSDLPPGQVLYVRAIDYGISLDGYPGDWAMWMPWAQQFGTLGQTPVTVLASSDGNFIYVLFLVRDRTRDYGVPYRPPSLKDHIIVAIQRAGEPLQFRIPIAAPGSFDLRAVNRDSAMRLLGSLRETPAGYSVEVRLPAAGVEGLGFSVWDTGSAGVLPVASLGGGQPVPLINTSAELNQRLASVALRQDSIWLVNSAGWVLARHSPQLQFKSKQGNEHPGFWSALAYRLLLAPDSEDVHVRPSIAVRLDSPEVLSALDGQPAVRWSAGVNEQAVRASVAVPLRRDGTVAGALVLEERAEAMLLFTNAALLRLVGLTLIVFIVVGLALLGFASILSWRILRLRDSAEQFISEDGRPSGAFPAPRAQDEIGDLGRSFARVLEELKGHTDYLRNLADKLSHEMRTPLAMVRSSLEHLEQQAISDEAAGYAHRAQDGASRLAEILRAMGEASRLDRSIQNAEVEAFDMVDLIANYMENWRALAAPRRVIFDTQVETAPFRGAPELIARLLDKLMENALDFTPQDGSIQVELSASGGQCLLTVTNDGPALPQGAQRLMFESLVSLRESKGDTPHLGLGLYLARLIAEYHRGGIQARNVKGGVRFEVVLRSMA